MRNRKQKQKRGRDDKEVLGGIKEQNQKEEYKNGRRTEKNLWEEKDWSRRVENSRKFGGNRGNRKVVRRRRVKR